VRAMVRCNWWAAHSDGNDRPQQSRPQLQRAVYCPQVWVGWDSRWGFMWPPR
jgi:hypothetical protein